MSPFDLVFFSVLLVILILMLLGIIYFLIKEKNYIIAVFAVLFLMAVAYVLGTVISRVP